MAQTSVKGPDSQQGDCNSFLRPRKTKARNRWPQHSSKAQARIKDMVNRLLYLKRTRPATNCRNNNQRTKLATRRWSIIIASQREEGLQQIAQTSIKRPGSQQGDGKLFLHLKENKVCNTLLKHTSKDQARNK